MLLPRAGEYKGKEVLNAFERHLHNALIPDHPIVTPRHDKHGKLLCTGLSPRQNLIRCAFHSQVALSTSASDVNFPYVCQRIVCSSLEG